MVPAAHVGAEDGPTPLDMALLLAEAGYHVFPCHVPDASSPNGCSCRRAECKKPGKCPATTNGHLDATTDPGRIEALWRARPHLNIGVALRPSGVIAVAPDSPEWLEEFRRRGLRETMTVQSGGGVGHLHYYYRLPDGWPTKRTCRAGAYDILSDGYTVGPGSRTTGRYELLTPITPVSMLPEPDPWVREFLGRSERKRSGASVEDDGDLPVRLSGREMDRWRGDLVERTPDGEVDRSLSLFFIGLALAEAGASRSTIIRALEERDVALGWNKYADREDAGTRYAEIADDALSPGPDAGGCTHLLCPATGCRRNGSAANGPARPRPGDGEQAPLIDAPWPDPIAPEAYHGLAGRIVRAIEPHTEADPVALLLQFLTAFGNLIHRGPHFIAEADYHALKLNVVMVGVSSKGRKGSSWGQVRRIAERVDRDWTYDRVQSGLSSGEGLIWAVRDPIVKTVAVKEKGRPTGEYEEVVEDPGVSDKRLLVLEAEFASTLRVLGRDGSTLSAIIRHAWDSGNLRSMTKNSPAQATGAHISIIGHITRAELRRYLDTTEAGNGFGNRFLWIAVRRSKVLPRGGALDAVDFEPLVRELRDAVDFARRTGELTPYEAGWQLWEAVYPELSEGKPGLLGAMVARGEAYVMRLACQYALLDRSALIRPEHLKAALAVWDYAEQSARWIFGSALGDPVADEILGALRARPEGMTRTEISELFGRNRSAGQIGRALGVLVEHNLARAERVESDRPDGRGRPAERWFAVAAGN